MIEQVARAVLAKIDIQQQVRDSITTVVNELVHGLRRRAWGASWGSKMGRILADAITDQIKSDLEEHTPRAFRKQAKEVVRSWDEYLNSEEFIDEVVDRIKRKQLQS